MMKYNIEVILSVGTVYIRKFLLKNKCFIVNFRIAFLNNSIQPI